MGTTSKREDRRSADQYKRSVDMNTYNSNEPGIPKTAPFADAPNVSLDTIVERQPDKLP